MVWGGRGEEDNSGEVVADGQQATQATPRDVRMTDALGKENIHMQQGSGDAEGGRRRTHKRASAAVGQALRIRQGAGTDHHVLDHVVPPGVVVALAAFDVRFGRALVIGPKGWKGGLEELLELGVREAAISFEDGVTSCT